MVFIDWILIVHFTLTDIHIGRNLDRAYMYIRNSFTNYNIYNTSLEKFTSEVR